MSDFLIESHKVMREYTRPAVLANTLILSILLIQGCMGRTVVEPQPIEKPQNDFQLAEKYYEIQAYDKALVHYGAFIRQFPQSVLAPAALMKIAQIHEQRRNWEDARLAYERIIREHAYSVFAPDAGVEALNMLFKQKNYQEVIRQYQNIPKKTLSRIHRIRILALAGDSYLAVGFPGNAAMTYVDALESATSIEKETIKEKLAKAYLLLDERGKADIDSRLQAAGDLAFAEKLRQMVSFRMDTIGCILPLTGPYGEFGQKALRGIELALHQSTLQQGQPFQIIVKDYASNPKTAAQLVNDLVEEKVGCIIGPLGEARVAAEAAQNKKIPIIILSQAEGLPETGDYVFRNFITPKMQVQALVRYAFERIGAQRFAVLYPKEKYGTMFMNLFKEAVVQQNGEVIAVEAYDTLGMDFSAPIGRIAAALSNRGASNSESVPNPEPGVAEMGFEGPMDVLFIPDSPKKAALIIPQLAYHDVNNIQIFGTNLWHTDEFARMVGLSAKGAILPDGFFRFSPSHKVQSFVSAYQDTYNEIPGFIEAVSYDTANIVFHILSGEGIVNRSGIRDALAGMTYFDGVTGRTAFGADGETEKQLYLLKIAGTGFSEVLP
jgi:branched-chain amino acid transport system substrate-binding protein